MPLGGFGGAPFAGWSRGKDSLGMEFMDQTQRLHKLVIVPVLELMSEHGCPLPKVTVPLNIRGDAGDEGPACVGGRVV